MKYTIMGFSQARAVELGLDVVDLCILRWIVDFSNTNRMVKLQVENKIYYWVKYEGLLEDMPILNIGKDRLYRKLKEMVEKEVLEHTTVKMNGTYSVYKTGRNFDGLAYDPKKYERLGENTEGLGENTEGGSVKTTEQKTNLLKNKSTIKESIEQSSTIPYSEIISYLNTKADTSFRSNGKDSQKYIKARWKEGFRLEDFFKVVDTKVSEWKHDEKMAQYIRPRTLFGEKFESYLNQSPRKKEAVSTPVRAEDKAKNPDGSYVTF